jgi:hypothetical protein
LDFEITEAEPENVAKNVKTLKKEFTLEISDPRSIFKIKRG